MYVIKMRLRTQLQLCLYYMFATQSSEKQQQQTTEFWHSNSESAKKSSKSRPACPCNLHPHGHTQTICSICMQMVEQHYNRVQPLPPESMCNNFRCMCSCSEVAIITYIQLTSLSQTCSQLPQSGKSSSTYPCALAFSQRRALRPTHYWASENHSCPQTWHSLIVSRNKHSYYSLTSVCNNLIKKKKLQT